MNAPLVAVALLIAAPVGAAARPDVPTYAIKMRIDPAAQTIVAHADVANLRLTAKAPATFLLGGTYHVDRIKAGPGVDVAVTLPPGPGAPQTIIMTCKACTKGQRTTLSIDYGGPLAPSDGTNEVSASRLELSADSLWYPLSTNFNTRILFDLKVSGLPRGFVIASADEVRRVGSSFEIRRRRPHPDIALTGAPGLVRVRKGKLDFFAVGYRGALSQGYLRNGPAALAYLEQLYGPLPDGRAVVSIVSRKSGIGYSRPGYVVVADNQQPVKADDVWAREGYLAHELSHAWWSNADFTGEDYWLVESTAEYSALRFIESRDGRAVRDRLLAAKQDRARRGGPILGHGRPSGDAVYAKGPIMLFALEDKIGRPRLDAILALLARRDTITTADFLDLLKASAGADVAGRFEADLRR